MKRTIWKRSKSKSKRSGNLVISLLAPTFVPELRQPVSGIQFFDDPVAMKREVLKHISVGMQFRRAQAVLESNGFHCWLVEARRQLGCYASKPSSCGLTTRQFRVWITYDERRVITNIRVMCFGEGP
jgi:hypothetical protein